MTEREKRLLQLATEWHRLRVALTDPAHVRQGERVTIALRRLMDAERRPARRRAA